MMPFTGLNYSPVYASPECLAKQKEIVELTKGGDGTVSERIAVLKEHQQDMYRRQAELDRAFKKSRKISLLRRVRTSSK